MHSFVALVAAATCSSPCDDVVFSKRVTSLYNDYRLGDILAGHTAPGKTWENQTKTWYVCKKWPLSLACRYRQATRNHHDVAVLSSLLPATRPENTTVLHVRLGDGAGGPGCWEIPCYGQHGNLQGAGGVYSFPRHHYAQVVQQLPQRPITVVANPYHGNTADVQRSLVHLKLIVCFLRAYNFTVTYHGDYHAPDNDFTTMATTDVFVRGGGGYSRFAARVVKSRNNTVL